LSDKKITIFFLQNKAQYYGNKEFLGGKNILFFFKKVLTKESFWDNISDIGHGRGRSYTVC
jgi:hypothetical protein